jgi:hypothetical protein
MTSAPTNAPPALHSAPHITRPSEPAGGERQVGGAVGLATLVTVALAAAHAPSPSPRLESK